MAPVTESAVISCIARPPRRQARASGRRRVPLQSGHTFAIPWGGWGRGSAEPPDPLSLGARLGSTPATPSVIIAPKPWQVGHAPYGLLKLNVRGSISPMLVPQRGHA